eukprot:s5232_g2.t1
MGKWTPRKSAGKRVAKDGKTKGKYPPGIPFYKLLVKASLRSWPDEDGWMLLTDKQAPSDYFTASKLAEQLTAESSDRIARPGLGVSMASVSLESCAAALAVLPASSADKKYAQTGIPAVKKLLEALRASLAVANMTNRECADASSASPHIEKVLKKLGKQDACHGRLRTLAANPKAWAKKIPDEPKQDKAVQKFVRKKTLESCVQAVASTNAARLEAKAPRKKRALGDSSNDGEADSGSESDQNSGGKESHSGSDQDSRSEEAPAPERSVAEKPPAVDLAVDDEEDGAEEDAADPHLSWEESEVTKFADELQTMVTHQDSKKERLPLPALVALLDNVPEAVLMEHGLAKVPQTLKQMTRLPKKEKLIKIFESM